MLRKVLRFDKLLATRLPYSYTYSFSVLSWIFLSLPSSRPFHFDPLSSNKSSRALAGYTQTRMFSNNQHEAPKIWEEGREAAMEKAILPLSFDSHKGSSGRIAVIGGSFRYTGAPYYAAMASLNAGADLAFVFSAEEACLPIKCYSPELMVAPIYCGKEMDELVRKDQVDSPLADELVDKMVGEVTPLMDKIHTMVIGPGLGRCPLVFRGVAKIIEAAKQNNIFLVLDADALYMISLPEYRGILRGYERAVLTPNVVEYKRIFPDEGVGPDEDFASVTIVKKGREDAICVGGTEMMVCAEEGGPKRSGGIGDILSGTLGTLVAWHDILQDRKVASSSDLPLACWSACCFVKRSTKAAFNAKGRAMTAPDILVEMGATIDAMTKS